MARFRQPDRSSCGAAVLVMARMRDEPGYDRWVRETEDPQARFADEALRTHRRTNRPLDARGRLQVPWPRALGTLPWALAREMSGARRIRLVLDRDEAWQRLAAGTGPSALYVGSRWLPRHVVLVLGRSDSDGLEVYEPSAGTVVTVAREPFLDGRLRLAGWDVPWFTAVPAGQPAA